MGFSFTIKTDKYVICFKFSDNATFNNKIDFKINW